MSTQPKAPIENRIQNLVNKYTSNTKSMKTYGNVAKATAIGLVYMGVRLLLGNYVESMQGPQYNTLSWIDGVATLVGAFSTMSGIGAGIYYFGRKRILKEVECLPSSQQEEFDRQIQQYTA